MPRNRTSAARTFLAGYVAGAAASGRERLPSVRELAELAGASRSAMQRAVERLSADGLITSRHGSGAWLMHASACEECRPSGRRRMEDICALIERDILTGALPGGERIPYRMMLMDRYGVSYRTLRRALERLCSEGKLLPDRRSYRVREIRPARRQVLYLFVGSHHSHRPSHIHMHTVERECAKANLRLVVVRHRWQGRRLVFDHDGIFHPNQLADTMGFMVWTVCYPEETCAELLRILGGFDKPVAVLDERHGYHHRPIPFANRRMRCVPIAVRADEGAAVGRYLLNYGHRRMLYIGRTPEATVGSRLEGIRGVHARAGHADGILVAHVPEALCAVAGKDTTRLCTVLSGPVAKAIENGVTAIVGYNDNTALAVLHYLRTRSVAVPERISVVGFDDSYEASLAGLTSYNFNSEAAIALLVGHTVAGPSPRARTGAQLDKVEGFLTERDSSGPVWPDT